MRFLLAIREKAFLKSGVRETWRTEDAAFFVSDFDRLLLPKTGARNHIPWQIQRSVKVSHERGWMVLVIYRKPIQIRHGWRWEEKWVKSEKAMEGGKKTHAHTHTNTHWLGPKKSNLDIKLKQTSWSSPLTPLITPCLLPCWDPSTISSALYWWNLYLPAHNNAVFVPFPLHSSGPRDPRWRFEGRQRASLSHKNRLTLDLTLCWIWLVIWLHNDGFLHTSVCESRKAEMSSQDV